MAEKYTRGPDPDNTGVGSVMRLDFSCGLPDQGTHIFYVKNECE